jgi:Dolichyl-phosphate-mannose-protein mannosyltransferase
MSPNNSDVGFKIHSVNWQLILLPTAAAIMLHLVVNALDSYGIFRDEYYYLACAKHLAWGYVDQPPLSLFLLAIQTVIFGDSLFALRLLPSLLSGVVVLLAGLTAREFGGNKLAQGSAALLALFVPCFLGFGGYYSMNIVDLSIWAAVIFLLARLSNGSDRRLWLLVGILLGLGLLNKLSVLYLGVGMLAGMLLSPLRRHLLTPWPWIAAGIAFLMLLPHVLWQISNGWPTLEFIENATLYKNAELSPLGFLSGVMFEGNPMFLPFWILALAYAFLSKRLRQHRWVGWLAATVIIVLIVSGSAKPYYADPAFFPMVAVFGVALEQWVRWRWVQIWALAHVVIGGLIVQPFAIPVLSPAQFVAYSNALGMTHESAERSELAELPQFYADRFGWSELAVAVADAYHSLSPEEKSVAVIFGQNYGEAGAVEYFSDDLDLPTVISGHNSFWFWGYGDTTGEVMIVIGDERDRLLEFFESVELSSIRHSDYCMPYENDLPIWICRGMKITVEELWSEVRFFI